MKSPPSGSPSITHHAKPVPASEYRANTTGSASASCAWMGGRRLRSSSVSSGMVLHPCDLGLELSGLFQARLNGRFLLPRSATLGLGRGRFRFGRLRYGHVLSPVG